VEADTATLAATCAFCDTPLVDSAAASEQVDRVAPFVVPRDRAGRALKGFLQGQLWAPEAVRRVAAPEELNAVLVPFYLYDAVARTQFSCQVGVNWQRTESYTTTENGETVQRTRTVTETEWFDFAGSHGKTWRDHLVSASRGLLESEANALEPFDIGKSLPYAPALTAGLTAEHPTVPHDQAHATAREELGRREAEAIATSHLPGDSHRALQTTTALDVEAVRLVLLPVWIAAFRGPSGALRLLVNGQTGEVVGKVPKSKAKIGCAIAGALLVLMAILLGFLAFSGALALVGTVR
jgi:hypothetical protein